MLNALKVVSPLRQFGSVVQRRVFNMSSQHRRERALAPIFIEFLLHQEVDRNGECVRESRRAADFVMEIQPKTARAILKQLKRGPRQFNRREFAGHGNNANISGNHVKG